jgi:hypothetical protein
VELFLTAMAPFPTAALQHFSFSNTTLPSIILEVACTSAGKQLAMAKELPCPIELTPHDIIDLHAPPYLACCEAFDV